MAWQTLFQEAVSASRTAKACTAAFETVLAHFNVDCFACGEVDLIARDRSVFYAIGWPEAWRKFYMETLVIERDPLVDALHVRRAPFSWSELREDPTLALEGRRMFQIAASAGWTEGLVVPISRSPTRVGLVSLAARRPAFSPDEKAQLSLASTFFHHHIRTLTQIEDFPQPPVGLTAREFTCLTMVAEGRSDRDIAEQLAISVTTAHEHVERAKRKLHAKTRASAVAIAVTLGIVKL